GDEWFLFSAGTTGLNVCGDGYYESCYLGGGAYQLFAGSGCTGQPYSYIYSDYGTPATDDPFAFKVEVQPGAATGFFTRPSAAVEREFSQIMDEFGSQGQPPDCGRIGGTPIGACGDEAEGADCVRCCIPPSTKLGTPIRMLDVAALQWRPPFRLD